MSFKAATATWAANSLACRTGLLHWRSPGIDSRVQQGSQAASGPHEYAHGTFARPAEHHHEGYEHATREMRARFHHLARQHPKFQGAFQSYATMHNPFITGQPTEITPAFVYWPRPWDLLSRLRLSQGGPPMTDQDVR